MARTVRDYYRVEVPSDYSTDPEERARVAFAEAEARTRIYAIPCRWVVVADDGEVVTVRRDRSKVE